jgi:hypothetical protein
MKRAVFVLIRKPVIPNTAECGTRALGGAKAKMKINPVQVGVAQGSKVVRGLPYAVAPLALPPEVLAQLSSSVGLLEPTMRSSVATASRLTTPATSGLASLGSSKLGRLAGYSFPVWQYPTVLPGSVLGQLDQSGPPPKPILVMPPGAPAASESPKYLSLGNHYWWSPLPATPLSNISHVANISQLAVEGLKSSPYAAYLLPQVSQGVDVFVAAVAVGEIYQEIASPKVEGRFGKFLFFAKRLVYLFQGINVFVPVYPAIDYPLKAIGTVLKIGDEVIALEFRRERPLGLSTF